MADNDIAAAIDELRNEVGDEVVAELIGLYDASLSERTAEIETAIEKGDCEAVASHAHALIGSVANFRAAEALRLMRDLESSAREGASRDAMRPLYERAKAEALRVRAVVHSYR
ncbi:MAG TPA: Hpt domain-containing protein [Candidatus Baltobacteraceae bacterium]|nr:Hpt domain-containing protein [Candidatus Baltobacteraceae bacterium]